MSFQKLAPVLVSLLIAAPVFGQYQLVWQDEFNGSSLDTGKWEPMIGTGCPNLCGWGNNELEYYRAENATVAGGFLTITAREESFGGMDYTSARLRTKNMGDWTYGRIEMRAKMPTGQGLWPAFWMLPTDEVYGGWAASGEIDIMELLGQEPDKIHGTIHYGGGWPSNTSSGNSYTLSSGTFNDDFHEFAIEWEPYVMRWYVDGSLYSTKTSWYSDGGPYPAPFDQRFHLLLNVAVGGNWPGPPNGSTSFPQEMVVDWVRVYQIPGSVTCDVAFDDMNHGDPFNNGWFAFGGSEGGGGIDANFSDLPPVVGGSASLQSGWGSGGNPGYFGGFGRTNPRDLSNQTHFSFWINPDPGQDYTLEINLQDDDNGDNAFPGSPDGNDDEFQYNVQVGPAGPHAISGGGWQQVVIPLADFYDDNSYHWGGNGVFDPSPVGGGGNGQLINIVVTVISNIGADVTFRTDEWMFDRRTAGASGLVWDDLDGDGVLDGGEPGLPGVTVELFDTTLGVVAASQSTAPDGTYAFSSQPAGSFELRIDTATLPAGYAATGDPDGVGTPDVCDQPMVCDELAADRDFGYNNAASDAPQVPGGHGYLRQNVPNPFNPSTIITFSLQQAGYAELAVFDLSGRRVRTLVSGNVDEGDREVVWDGRDDTGVQVGSGVYLYRLIAGDVREARRMVLLK